MPFESYLLYNLIFIYHISHILNTYIKKKDKKPIFVGCNTTGDEIIFDIEGIH